VTVLATACRGKKRALHWAFHKKNSNEEMSLDLTLAIAGLNWLAILAAAVTAFLIGAAWYSPKVFGTVWMHEIGLTDRAISENNSPLIFGATFVLQFVGATALALFLGQESDWIRGLQTGLLIGLCLIATAYGITYFFEQRSLRLYLINAGHYVLMFSAMGMIIGALN
jgi:hypothetical protein